MPILVKRCCIAIAVSFALASSAALAQEHTAQFELNLPEQVLANSLRAVGKAAHVNIVFDPATAAGRRAPALSGKYTPDEALERLLAGSGLIVRLTPGGSFAVEALQSPAAESASEQQHDGNIYTFDPLLVIGKIEGFSATRLPTDLRDIPQSVSVISQETLREQNATDLAKAFNWATGITIVQDGSTSDRFFSRGFEVTTVHVDNGGPSSRNAIAGFMAREDLSNYDRVEILRGVDALFGGMGRPGASINLMRKRPLTENAVSVAISAGSWDNYRVETDISGKLSADGRLRARTVIVDESQRYFYDFAKRRMNKLYAIAEYDLFPSTLLALGGSYEHVPDFVQFADGLPRYENGADPRLPRSTALTFPWAENTSTKREGFAQLRQAFGDRWQLKAGFTRIEQEQDGLWTSNSSAINPVTHLMTLPSLMDVPISTEQSSFDLTLTGSFDWNGRSQELIFGADQWRFKLRSDAKFLELSGPPLDPFNFDPTRYSVVTTPQAFRHMVMSDSTRYGFYAALKLRPAERWTITAGARDNSYRHENETALQFGDISMDGTRTRESGNGTITPYAGVVYEINPRYSLYASYAEVFVNATPALTAAGEILDTEQGINKEVGVKATWNAGLLTGSLALFEIDQRNVALPDPNTPPTASGCCSVAGAARSKGLEAELNGVLTPGWQFGAGYTFNMNSITDGRMLSTQTPKHLLKLWTNYRLPGSASGWTIGGGLTAQTSNYLEDNVCTEFDPFGDCIGEYVPYRAQQGFFSVATLRVGYRLNDQWDVALNVDNVFDRRYYATIAGARGNNWYGAPRSWMLTLRGEF